MRDDVLDRALPYLRGIAFGAGDVQLLSDDAPVIRLISDDLVTTYVSDEGLSMINHGQLRAAGLDPEALHASACENLEGYLETLSVHPHGKIFTVNCGGNFEASLILLDSLWDGPFRKFVGDDYAAVVPARDLLAFCSASSPGALSELRDVVTRSASTDHPISTRTYYRAAGRWETRPT